MNTNRFLSFLDLDWPGEFRGMIAIVLKFEVTIIYSIISTSVSFPKRLKFYEKMRINTIEFMDSKYIFILESVIGILYIKKPLNY